MIEVYFANKEIKKGEKLEEKQFSIKKIRKENFAKNFIKVPYNFLNMYANVDISRNSIILKEMLESNKVKDIPSGKCLFSLEFSGENAIVWDLKKEEKITLILKTKDINVIKERESNLKIYKNLIIYKILDENYKELDKENEFQIPRYIIFIANNKEALEIISKKETSIITLIKE